MQDNENLQSKGVTPIQFIRLSLEVYNEFCKSVCKQFDIQQSALNVLLFLANNPTLNEAKDISKFLGIKPSIVSFHVERLVEDGLIERQAVPGDRRRIKLVCTPQSTPIIEQGKAVQQRYAAMLADGITEQERALFGSIGARMLENLQIAKKQLKEGILV